VWGLVAKKKKKKKQKTLKIEEEKDFGSQPIINVDGKYIRLPDYKEIILSAGRVELKIKSVLHKYFTNNQLCPQDAKKNAVRHLAGEKMEYLSVLANVKKSPTQNWDRIEGLVVGGYDLININSFDAHSVFTKALNECKPHDMILYDLIVEDQPCGRKNMDRLRECLDNCANFFKIK
jgi:hypothetical protein